LLSHYGQHFDKIAYLYDSTHECYVWAHNLVNLHYSDDCTDYPIDFRLWAPAELDTIETGLTAAGVRIRPSKYALKDSELKKWRQYLLGLWRRHQHQPEVAKLYQSKLTVELAGALALANCCCRSTSASRAATWGCLGSSSRA
jgi:hypothetical protein